MTNAGILLKDNAGLRNQPNRLSAKSHQMTIVNAVHTSAAKGIAELDEVVQQPLGVPAPTYDKDGHLIKEYHQPITDCVMSNAEKIERITSIKTLDQMCKLLLNSPRSTNVISRIARWHTITANVERKEMTRALLEISVAHWNISALLQNIIEIIPEQALMEIDRFKTDVSCIILPGSHIHQLLSAEEKEKCDRIVEQAGFLFQQIIDTTIMLDPTASCIMSYEEAQTLLQTQTLNRRAELWPINLSIGSPKFYQLQFISKASHDYRAVREVERYLKENPAISATIMSDRPIEYYKTMIELIEESPNSSVEVSDHLRRTELESTGDKKMHLYHDADSQFVPLYPSLNQAGLDPCSIGQVSGGQPASQSNQVAPRPDLNPVTVDPDEMKRAEELVDSFRRAIATGLDPSMINTEKMKED